VPIWYSSQLEQLSAESRLAPRQPVSERVPVSGLGLRKKATWKREFKLPWREAGPPNHHDDKVDSDQEVVNKELSLRSRVRGFGRRDLGAGLRNYPAPLALSSAGCWTTTVPWSYCMSYTCHQPCVRLHVIHLMGVSCHTPDGSFRLLHVIHLIGVKYEPASDPLHISVK